MTNLAFGLYFIGLFFTLDALGNLNTIGHNWTTELTLGLALGLIGGLIQFITKR